MAAAMSHAGQGVKLTQKADIRPAFPIFQMALKAVSKEPIPRVTVNHGLLDTVSKGT